MAKQELQGTKGIQKAFGEYIFYRSYLDKDELKKDSSPYRYIRYRDNGSNVGMNIMQRVLTLCEISITRELYGLTFKDLMCLDLTTFEEIEERIHNISEKKGKVIKDLEDKIKPSGE